MTYNKLKDRNSIVSADWLYSYDGGGLILVIPEIGPVPPEWVGKPACSVVVAWEYFLVPATSD